MNWQVYKLVYQAKSPVHIGWHKLGFIQRTRYYITGKSMWGAMTDNITRTFYQEVDAAAYKNARDKLKTDIIPSYFYPAIDPANPLLPEFTPEGLKYGNYPAEDFERQFISSFGQTAIEATNLTAEETTLHETEYLAPMTKDRESVYFVGYIFMKADTVDFDGQREWKDINNAISEIFVGGERRYGFGRLNLISTEPASNFFGYKIENESFKIPEKNPIPGHLLVENNPNLKGDIEPLVGREWREEVKDEQGNIYKGFGQCVTKAEICWVPGSIIEEDKTLKIGHYGILE